MPLVLMDSTVAGPRSAQRMRHIVEAFLRAGANIHEAVTAQVSGMAPLVPEAAGKRRVSGEWGDGRRGWVLRVCRQRQW